MLRFERHPNVAGRVVAGLAFLVTSDNRLQTLNATATRIWEAAKTPTNVDEVAALLCAEFDVSMDTARADVEECVGDLIKRSILTANAP